MTAALLTVAAALIKGHAKPFNTKPKNGINYFHAVHARRPFI
jgi:hypothetical protein